LAFYVACQFLQEWASGGISHYHGKNRAEAANLRVTYFFVHVFKAPVQAVMTTASQVASASVGHGENFEKHLLP
jgi:hypothetical protein